MGAIITNLSFIGGLYTNPVQQLLDTLSIAPASAYSLRLLRVGYTGAAIRVRRSSDNTESDIGFSGGVLNQSALLAFTTSSSGYITTWYDQIGTTNFTQASTSNQPRIVNAGTLLTLNGLPAIEAIASNGTYMNSAISLSAATLTTISVATLRSASGQYARFLSAAQSGQLDYNNGSYCVPLDRVTTTAQVMSERNGNSFGATTSTYGTTFTHSAKWDGTNLTVAFNGSTISTTGSSGNFSTTLLRLFNDTSNQFLWDGFGQEVLVFINVPTTGDMALVQASQKAFYGTP